MIVLSIVVITFAVIFAAVASMAIAITKQGQATGINATKKD